MQAFWCPETFTRQAALVLPELATSIRFAAHGWFSLEGRWPLSSDRTTYVETADQAASVFRCHAAAYPATSRGDHTIA
jgi:hypothetical protein